MRYDVIVAGFTGAGIAARNVGASFSSIPQQGKLNALMWTAVPSSGTQIADKVGKSRVAVTNTVRLLRLPQKIQDGLARGQITEGHARAILGAGSEAAQLALFDKIVKQGLTVKQVEEGARTTMAKPRRTERKIQARDPQLAAIEEALSHRFGAPVFVHRSNRGGHIEIRFYSEDDLERVLEELGIRV